mmetsp:Transcript_24043/g.56739  ORF Transcript_24043/g.56739 Transcript_24043/m.56739 type:complete len:200 (-) Transcript_24043:244-843(-)
MATDLGRETTTPGESVFLDRFRVATAATRHPLTSSAASGIGAVVTIAVRAQPGRPIAAGLPPRPGREPDGSREGKPRELAGRSSDLDPIGSGARGFERKGRKRTLVVVVLVGNLGRRQGSRSPRSEGEGGRRRRGRPVPPRVGHRARHHRRGSSRRRRKSDAHVLVVVLRFDCVRMVEVGSVARGFHRLILRGRRRIVV